MQAAGATSETFVPESSDETSTVILALAYVCFGWYIIVAVVCTIGYLQLYAYTPAGRNSSC